MEAISTNFTDEFSRHDQACEQRCQKILLETGKELKDIKGDLTTGINIISRNVSETVDSTIDLSNRVIDLGKDISHESRERNNTVSSMLGRMKQSVNEEILQSVSLVKSDVRNISEDLQKHFHQVSDTLSNISISLTKHVSGAVEKKLGII